MTPTFALCGTASEDDLTRIRETIESDAFQIAFRDSPKFATTDDAEALHGWTAAGGRAWQGHSMDPRVTRLIVDIDRLFSRTFGRSYNFTLLQKKVTPYPRIARDSGALLPRYPRPGLD